MIILLSTFTTFRWYKVNKSDGLPHPLSDFQRFEYRTGSLIVRNVRASDTNRYVCVASNSIGEAKCETELLTFAPLRVSVSPKKLVVDVNQRAVINCSIQGYPWDKITWLHNGEPIAPHDEARHIQLHEWQSIIVINAVSGSDQGMI